MIDEQHENLKNEESKKLKLNQINAKLQHQVDELNEVSFLLSCLLSFLSCLFFHLFYCLFYYLFYIILFIIFLIIFFYLFILSSLFLITLIIEIHPFFKGCFCGEL